MFGRIVLLQSTLCLRRQLQIILLVFCFRNGSTAYCDVHGKECLLYGAGDDGAGRCVIGAHWAGTTCLDATAFGAGRGMFGPLSAILLLWVHERRVR